MSDFNEDVTDNATDATEAEGSDADADQETYRDHRSRDREIQAACDAVLAAGLGTDADAIADKLRIELQARGHWPQPERWLDAVIEEIQIGHHYRVSGLSDA